MGLFAADEIEVIRAHRFDTVCYLVADAGECIALGKGRAEAVTGRKRQYSTTADLPKRPPRSWMMAIILCDGHDMDGLAGWARQLGLADIDRIAFYEPESLSPIDAVRLLRRWMEAGLPMPIRQRFKDFRELNRLIGHDLNSTILRDYGGRP